MNHSCSEPVRPGTVLGEGFDRLSPNENRLNQADTER